MSFTIAGSTTATSSTIQLIQLLGGSVIAEPLSVSGTGGTIGINVAPPITNSLSCNPTSVTGPGSSVCTVTLNKAAGPGGVVVALGYSSAGVTVTMPSSLTIASGNSSGQFPVQVGVVAGSAEVGLSATANGSTSTATLTVLPLVSVSVSPASATLTTGQSQQFSATISGSSNTGVVWSLNPSVGTLSSSGLYTAPGSISSVQTVTVKATSVADSTKSASAIVTLQPSSIGGGVAIRVNAGGPAYTDSAGNVWSADTGYNTGLTYSTTAAVTGTTTQALYQSERYNPDVFRYQFSVPNGNYNVNLKFAEIYFNTAGSRAFNVAINGQAVLANFDIVAVAGGAFKAVDRQFPVSVSNGSISIQLTPVIENPTISAIEIVAATGTSVSISPVSATLSANQSQQFSATVTGTTNSAVAWSLSPAVGTISSSGLYTAPASITSVQTVTAKATSLADSTKSASATVTLQPPSTGGVAIRVNAGGPAFTDSLGSAWSADFGYSSGLTYTTTAAVSGTPTPLLYQSERYNRTTLTYQFLVPNGNYDVNLKFAEIYFGTTGMRSFNVAINGQVVLTNFDIVAVAGGAFKAVDRQFPVSVSNGSISIQLTPVIENPKISAIEIKSR